MKLAKKNRISVKLAGYNTYVVGKWHVGTKSVPEDYGIKGHNFDGYGYPGSGVYKNLVFNQPPTHSNRYKEWLEEKGYEIPEVSRAYFGDNPHLRRTRTLRFAIRHKRSNHPLFHH